MLDSQAELQAIVGDRYEVERELARGGMAVVYLARDRRHGRQVAVKVMDPSVVGSVGVDRFLREIEIAAGLTHPHIIPLFDSGGASAEGSASGVLYYVMPYIAGESLRDRMAREGPLGAAAVSRIIREVASALDYAHRAGIVHRDIKPENVLLLEGHALVADFGIARALVEANGAPAGTLTQAGMLVGTPTYLSPEQAAGETVDGRADQYSLACVVFEMLAGAPPFVGGLMSLVAQHLTAPPPPLRAPIAVPDAAERVVHRALAKDRDDRFPTAEAFAEALDAALAPMTMPALRLAGRSRPLRGARLPRALTPLVGREQDVRTLLALLQREGVRLLTVHGPGGIGKTRLALGVAERALEYFPDGVFYVPLAEVHDVESLRARLAEALGLRGAEGAADAMIERLAETRALLVLDNFEQLVDAGAGELSALLAACPRVTALVTSQRLLRVYGEHECPVTSLRVPGLHQRVRLEVVAQSPAVQLFVQRAVAARPDFALDDSNVAAVAEICRAVDGVPLAIELAASRVRNAPPAQLLPRLRQALDVLTGGARDVPERQRTMRGAIAWSHDLLGANERAIFRRLAVFAGGATLSTAQGCADPDTNIEELLEALAEHSLVQRHTDATGEARFTMLRPVQAYADEMLTASGERKSTVARHAAAFEALALDAEPHLMRGDPVWLDRLDTDRENLRVAISALRQDGRVTEALRMAVAVWRFWDARSYAREGVDLLRSVLAYVTDDVPVRLRLSALYAAGVLADANADYVQARGLFEQHMALAHTLGDSRAVSVGRNNLAVLLLRQGAVDAAIPLFEGALAAVREAGDRRATAIGSANIGNAERQRRRFGAARERYVEALQLFREIGDGANVAWTLSHLGDLARDEGDVDSAMLRYRESMAAFSELHHQRGLGAVLLDIGELEAKRNRPIEARTLLEEALAQLGDAGDQLGMLRVIEALAGLAAGTGAAERAIRLAGAVTSLRDELGAPHSVAARDRLITRILPAAEQLGVDSTERVWESGLVMTIDELLNFVGRTDPV